MQAQKLLSGVAELRCAWRIVGVALMLSLRSGVAEADDHAARCPVALSEASMRTVADAAEEGEATFGDEAQTLDVSDPLEPVNRAVFWFNDTFDVFLLEPIAKGYDYIVPEAVQESIGNFFDTLRYPIYLFSDVITLDGDRALVDTARFGINASLGFLGFFDVADHFGYERKATDAGVAFGRWGIPEGPYIVLPILGASNLRDTVGEVFNFVLDPIVAVQFTQMSNANVNALSWGGGVTRTINRRSQMIPNVTSAKQASLDYYLFVQSAYAQYRRGLINGEESSEKALFDTRVDGE